MTGESLFEAIGLINDRFIAEADGQSLASRKRWIRWAAAAACVAVIATAVLPLALGGVRMKSSASDTNNSASDMNSAPSGDSAEQSIESESAPGDSSSEGKNNRDEYGAPLLLTLEFEGGIYEFAPSESARSEAGAYLGTAELSSGEAAKLYLLASDDESEGRATLVVQLENGDWGYARFCNVIKRDTCTMAELLALYGASEPRALVRAEILSWKLDKIYASTERDDWLSAFFEAYSELEGIGNDAWQREIFGGLDEPEQQRLSTEIADSLIVLRLAFSNGEQVIVNYYPDIAYLYQSGVYFKIDDTLTSLLADLRAQI